MESSDSPRPATPAAASPTTTEGNAPPLVSGARSATVLVAIVFLTTLVPALVNPVAGVLSGPGGWPLPMPPGLVFVVLVVGCAAQAASLLLSRKLPGTATAVTLLIYVALLFVLSVPQWLTAMHLVIALSLFLLGASHSARRTITWLALTVGAGVGALALWAAWSGASAGILTGFVLAQGLELAAPAAGGAALGLWWGAQSRRTTLVREEAERAKREHEERIARARAVERARIARELHDVAGQHLAGLITLSDAALSLATDRPEEALKLVEDVRSEGRFAAASLAGAIADLGAVEAAPVDATRDLRQISDLVEYWRRRGMELRLVTRGAVVDLPTVVSTTAYRAAQEALTNAAKHAPGAWVTVEVARADDALEIAVENGPRGAGSADVPGLDLGWGISGLRERVQLLRGSLWAGATPAGGWLLRMRVPIAPGENPE